MSYGLRDMDGVRVELCDECGFDAREPRDLPTAFAEAYASLEHLRGHPDAATGPRPRPGRARSTSTTAWTSRARSWRSADRGAGRPESAPSVSISEVAAATAELVHELSDAQWDAATDGGPIELSVRGAAMHLLHDLEHHVWDIRRGYAKLALAHGIEVVTSR